MWGCVCVCVCVCVCGFLGGSDSEESACNAGGLGLIPGKGRSPGERKGNPLHYSWLEKSMDRGAWWATVHGVTKSQTWLSDWHTVSIYTNHFAVHLNLTQHCRSIILQLKQRKKKKKTLSWLPMSFLSSQSCAFLRISSPVIAGSSSLSPNTSARVPFPQHILDKDIYHTIVVKYSSLFPLPQSFCWVPSLHLLSVILILTSFILSSKDH